MIFVFNEKAFVAMPGNVQVDVDETSYDVRISHLVPILGSRDSEVIFKAGDILRVKSLTDPFLSSLNSNFKFFMYVNDGALGKKCSIAQL